MPSLRSSAVTVAVALSCAESSAPRPTVTIPLREYVAAFYFPDASVQGRRHVVHVSEYYGRVAMGDPPQAFDVVFDTGSGNIVLPTVKCLDEACQEHRRYVSQDSRTAVQLAFDDGTPMMPGYDRDTTTITYGTGKLTGEYVRDRLCVGQAGGPSVGLSVCTDVDFLGVTQESRFPFSELPFDGIFGLGLAGLSAGPAFNFVGRMAANATSCDPVFAVFLRELQADESSEITFGGYRPDRLADGAGGLTWLPVLRDEAAQGGYWLVAMRDAYVRGVPLGLCNGRAAHPRCKVALDTGSSQLMGPPVQIDRLLRAIGGCEHPLPSLHLHFDAAGGGTFEMVLAPEDYAEVSTGDCAIAIQGVELPPTLGPMWVLGQAALRKYYSVYDASRWRIGMGLARHAPASLPSVPSGPAPPSGPEQPAELCQDDDRSMAWNHLPGCKTFQDMGYCRRFAPLAHRYCQLSCNFCSQSQRSSAPSPQVSTMRASPLRGRGGSDSARIRVRGNGFRVTGEHSAVVGEVRGHIVRAPTRSSWLLR